MPYAMCSYLLAHLLALSLGSVQKKSEPKRSRVKTLAELNDALSYAFSTSVPKAPEFAHADWQKALDMCNRYHSVHAIIRYGVDRIGCLWPTLCYRIYENTSSTRKPGRSLTVPGPLVHAIADASATVFSERQEPDTHLGAFLTACAFAEAKLAMLASSVDNCLIERFMEKTT